MTYLKTHESKLKDFFIQILGQIGVYKEVSASIPFAQRVEHNDLIAKKHNNRLVLYEIIDFESDIIDFEWIQPFALQLDDYLSLLNSVEDLFDTGVLLVTTEITTEIRLEFANRFPRIRIFDVMDLGFIATQSFEDRRSDCSRFKSLMEQTERTGVFPYTRYE